VGQVASFTIRGKKFQSLAICLTTDQLLFISLFGKVLSRSKEECCMKPYEEVREYCIRKLARILSECVACSHSDRAMLDWLTAEQWVNTNKTIVDGIYDCFQAAAAISPDQVQGFETFDRLCGRAVWDSLYQPLQKVLELPYQSTARYTHIRFS
jgi:hypothetical protein